MVSICYRSPRYRHDIELLVYSNNDVAGVFFLVRIRVNFHNPYATHTTRAINAWPNEPNNTRQMTVIYVAMFDAFLCVPFDWPFARGAKLTFHTTLLAVGLDFFHFTA